ncbi:hypothetical protein [Aestuariivirga sp.]|uniref:hypothetical protein n=1 Tax=Aestuariivirga sp. TaxID=2650926 RepID=UPI0039E47E8C
MRNSSIRFFILMAVAWTGLTAMVMAGLPKQESSVFIDEFGMVFSVVLLLGVQMFYWIIFGMAYFADYLGKNFTSTRAALIFWCVVIGGVLLVVFTPARQPMPTDGNLIAMILPLSVIALVYTMRILLTPRYEL